MNDKVIPGKLDAAQLRNLLLSEDEVENVRRLAEQVNYLRAEARQRVAEMGAIIGYATPESGGAEIEYRFTHFNESYANDPSVEKGIESARSTRAYWFTEDIKGHEHEPSEEKYRRKATLA